MLEQTRISEILKRNKSFKRPLLEERLYENIVNTDLDITILGTRSLNESNFRDYQDDKLKRRAQTISVAYNIATKLLLSLELTNTTETYWKNSEYKRDPQKLEELKTDNFDSFAYDTILNAVTQVDTLDKIYKESKDNPVEFDSFLVNLASLSVTLAWLEVFYKTSFMPRDYQIIHTRHEVHIGLTREVVVLLTNTLKIIKEQLPILRNKQNLQVEFDKQVSTEDDLFKGTANILINGTILLEIKTTGKQPNEDSIKKDFQHALGLRLLDKNIKELYIYYARYDFVVRADINE